MTGLETLAAWRLVEPGDGRWKLVPGTSLQLLAEQFGCLEQVRAQSAGTAPNGPPTAGIADRRPSTPAATVLSPVDEAEAYLCHPNRPPTTGTLMDLLHRELGAYLIGKA